MQSRPLLPLLLALATLLFTAGCQTVETRIKEKPDVYAGLDPATQAKIKQGLIDLSYTPDMVYIALGSPSEKREVITADGRAEVWIYSTYYENYDGIIAMGYRRRVYFDPIVGSYRIYYRPAYGDAYSAEREERIRVTFKEGKVAVIDQGKEK